MVSTPVKKLFHRRDGLSIVEIVLASGIFIIFSSGAVISLIQALNANRLGLEFTIASEYASEGLEAVRSLKNQDFTNLTNTTQSGITIVGGTWAFTGVGSTITHGKPYTRTITIEDVRRDSPPPAGNIVATGGTIDSDSKKITSTVTWNFTSARPESVSFTTYLSDWRKGSSWTGKANQDTSARAVTAGSKRIATGWVVSGGTSRSVITYNNSGTTNIGWVVGNSGVFNTQTDFAPSPLFANPQQWYDIHMDPTNTDRLMFTLSDNNSDVFAKRLVMSSTAVFTWSNADNSAALENSLGQASTSPFAFTYWSN